MTISIDVAEALHGLELALAERGADYVYPSPESCVYLNSITGEPDCLVAVALDKLGVSREDQVAVNGLGEFHELIEYDNDGDPTDARTIIIGFDITTDAILVLRAAQKLQDQGEPWGSAYEAAKWQAAQLGRLP